MFKSLRERLFGLIEKSPRPFVVMFVGVNGTGKTTTIAKLAYHIMKKGYTCVVAAADTFRAGAIEQLEKHAEAVGFKLIKHNAGADPAAVAFDAVEHARARGRDVVLIDTAGRMQTNQNLMDQMKKIKRVAKPNLILYIGDALAGNDAIEQAKQFHDAVGLDGIVLTKIDADAKGGAALSMAKTIGKPVVFVNVGQTYKDIRRFETKWMVDRLLAEAYREFRGAPRERADRGVPGGVTRPRRDQGSYRPVDGGVDRHRRLEGGISARGDPRDADVVSGEGPGGLAGIPGLAELGAAVRGLRRADRAHGDRAAPRRIRGHHPRGRHEHPVCIDPRGTPPRRVPPDPRAAVQGERQLDPPLDPR